MKGTEEDFRGHLALEVAFEGLGRSGPVKGKGGLSAGRSSEKWGECSGVWQCWLSHILRFSPSHMVKSIHLCHWKSFMATWLILVNKM